MREAGIGRVLVASLHQAISDVMPTRLLFYETWLSAEGLRGGTIGLSALYAVLSFLRQEGEAYDTITRKAGEYAAEWTAEAWSPMRRALLRMAPPWLRGRLLLRLASQLIGSSYRESRAIVRLRRGTASVDLRGSIFCTVREPVSMPLCGFYAAAVGRLLELFDVPVRTSVVACRGMGEATCLLTVAVVDPSGTA